MDLTYREQHCWQYDRRVKTLGDDLRRMTDSGMDVAERLSLKPADFQLAFEDKQSVFAEASTFIARYEWLGRLSLYPTHIFTARYKGMLCGVTVMDMPGAFSKLLGEGTRKIERVISRGACVSWSPRGLASRLTMFAVGWMARNTRYRLFTAYADPEARELGTIYQACNFYYLGRVGGTKKQYLVSNGSSDRWVSDRYFRCRSVYKRLAMELGISWADDWQDRDVVHFNHMPVDVASRIRCASKQYQESCQSRNVPSKHKYAYVLAPTKSETFRLRQLLVSRNRVLGYPKDRVAGC